MAFVEAPGIAEAALLYQSPGGEQVNTLYFIGDVEWDVLSLLALGEDIAAWWVAKISGQVGGEIVLYGVRCTSLVSETAPSVVYDVNPPEPGTHTSAQRLPGNVTMTVTFRTATRGRSSRGRNYVVGLTENQVAGDVVNGAVVAAYVAGYQDLLTDVTANGATHVVLSRYTGGGPRPEGIGNPVISYTSDGIVDSQRRRLTGRGA